MGVTSRSASTRSSRACRPSGMSPISSRNSVPPSADWISPRLARGPAPVKLPGRWPNSSLSIRPSGMAAQLTATNGLARRSLAACRALAKYSLPLPVSPVISRLTGLLASRAARSIWRSSRASPPDNAASGAGRRGAAGTGCGTRAAAGGGMAAMNSSCRPPLSITARCSAGRPAMNRPRSPGDTSSRAGSGWPSSGRPASAGRPCSSSWARRLWPMSRPAASSASR